MKATQPFSKPSPPTDGQVSTLPDRSRQAGAVFAAILAAGITAFVPALIGAIPITWLFESHEELGLVVVLTVWLGGTSGGVVAAVVGVFGKRSWTHPVIAVAVAILPVSAWIAAGADGAPLGVRWWTGCAAGLMAIAASAVGTAVGRRIQKPRTVCSRQ